MTGRTFLIVLLILVPKLALSEGIIRVKAPDGMNVPVISIYAENSPLEVPVALITGGEHVEVPDGKYVYGIDSFAWRSLPFSHVEETILTFGALSISAPEGVKARFTIHGTEKGALMLPVSAGMNIALPAGEFELRRDLASLTWPINIRAGQTTQMPLGAISLSGAIEGNSSVYVAADDVDFIAGILFSRNDVLALPEGNYRLRSMLVPNIISTHVKSREITVVPSSLLRFWSAGGSGGLTLRQGATNIQIDERTSGDILFLGNESVSVDAGGDEDPLNLTTAEEIWLWQYTDGNLAQDTGIPLTWAGEGEIIAVPGEDMHIETHFGRTAQAWVRILQGGMLVQQTNIIVPAGVSNLVVPLPIELSEETPLNVVLTTGPGGTELEAMFPDIPIHKYITESPVELTTVATTATEITLKWKATTKGGVVGYRVYRGLSEYAVSGQRPVSGPDYTDIALSAGREYTFRVCPVDALGFDGPCSAITARTEYSR